MSHDLWVVGGEQRVTFQELEAWRRFRTAVVLRVRDGDMTRALEYETPPERRAGEGSHCFKAATFTTDRAYLCTDTEVLICTLPGFRIETVISLPCFNDLHHVTPGPNGSLFVACTGLDAVAEVSPDGDLIRIVDVLGGSVWDRFSAEVDYRRVVTTKPHASHPNYVFFVGGEPWVTRFHQRDAVPLAEVGRPPTPVAAAGVHDGAVAGDGALLTSVDGTIVEIDGEGRGVRSVDLNPSSPGGGALGWCRGLLVEGGDRGWVGFTRLRHTTIRRNLSWLYHGLRQVSPHNLRPTRIALYDLARPALLEEVDTEPARVHAIFSIHRASAGAVRQGGPP
jgi:hypothetical protein